MTDPAAPTTPIRLLETALKQRASSDGEVIGLMNLLADALHEARHQTCACTAETRATPAEALDVSPEELRSRAKDIRDEFRADEAESGLDAALAHIALALAQAEARLPFEPETERIVRQTLAIVDQTTPLSVGEPLVRRVLARLADLPISDGEATPDAVQSPEAAS